MTERDEGLGGELVPGELLPGGEAVPGGQYGHQRGVEQGKDVELFRRVGRRG